VTSDALAAASLGLLRSMSALATTSLEQTAPELTLQQFRALTVLHEQGPQQASALAAALGIAPSTLTRLGNRLVRDGLVARTADPGDRRAVILTASRRGAATAERVKARRLAELSRRFADVAPGDRAPLLAALDRLTDGLGAGGTP
jgi:DNA-binding MarR family transcriptional regulator